MMFLLVLWVQHLIINLFLDFSLGSCFYFLNQPVAICMILFLFPFVDFFMMFLLVPWVELWIIDFSLGIFLGPNFSGCVNLQSIRPIFESSAHFIPCVCVTYFGTVIGSSLRISLGRNLWDCCHCAHLRDWWERLISMVLSYLFIFCIQVFPFHVPWFIGFHVQFVPFHVLLFIPLYVLKYFYVLFVILQFSFWLSLIGRYSL